MSATNVLYRIAGLARFSSLVVASTALALWTLGGGSHLLGKSKPPCRMALGPNQIPLPQAGFTWLESEELKGPCEQVPIENWIRKPSGTSDLFIHANGPRGSGRFWDVTIGVSEKGQAKPTRGICLTTTTIGWRTLKHYKDSPLPWLDDVDGDGKAEMILWSSFPLREEPEVSSAEYGMMAWVYRLGTADSLVLDWDLSRRMAREIAVEYRSPRGGAPPKPSSLRAIAADALEMFADDRCSAVPGNSR